MDTDETNDDMVQKSASQTAETVALYTRIFERLKTFTREDLEARGQALPLGEEPSADAIVVTFREREAGWSKSTAKLYRVALGFTLQNMGTPDAYDARQLLSRQFRFLYEDDEKAANAIEEAKAHDEQVAETRKIRTIAVAAGEERPKTSGQKAKRLKPSDLDRLLRELQQSQSIWAAGTQLWLMAGYFTGLRPMEWATAELGRDAKNRRVLVVGNAKATNGRAFGPVRQLVLERLSDLEYAAIEEHLRRTRREEAAGKFAKYYEGCRYFLYQVNTRLWPARTQHPTLYTARHMFASDAKSVFSRIEVAALMGHGSDKTAGLHYGKRQFARNGGAKIDPSEVDVAAVTKMNPSTGSGFDRDGKSTGGAYR